MTTPDLQPRAELRALMQPAPADWPTLAIAALCYIGWALSTTLLAAASLPLGIVATALFAALHSSLSHEVLHGHPFASRAWNEALVFPTLTIFIPYGRFRDTHLAHHLDENLTDPYDDPESNFLDPRVWARLAPWQRRVLLFNNTLLGRMLVGPLVAQIVFMRADWHAIRAGDRDVLVAWLIHVPSVALVLGWVVAVSAMPVWAYLIAAYLGLSVLKIRTFLEHRAHARARGRTVVIEDNGPLALMFLNNNYHIVHHMHPRVPWYRLPALYRAGKARYLSVNDDYHYPSYAEIFRRYFLTRKDPVPHPLWQPGPDSPDVD